MSLRVPMLALLVFCGTSSADRVSSADTVTPFDRTAAVQALEGVDLASCTVKRGLEGHVTITFDPTGHVTKAVVDRGPFVSTRTGRCIAAKYRRVSIPAFEGDPVRVGKKFHVD
jgi:hypothetical protein